MMIEIVRKAMPHNFRNIGTRTMRIVLVEGGPRLLPAAQEGKIAGLTALRIVNAETTRPFHYYNKGDLATIGRNRA